MKSLMLLAKIRDIQCFGILTCKEIKSNIAIVIMLLISNSEQT